MNKRKTNPVELPVSDKVLSEVALATERFESNFRSVHVYEGGPSPSRAPTGQLYHQFITARFPKADGALSAWVSRVLPMVPQFPSDLYWRVKPEINCFSGKHGGWAIYSRFLISDKPRIS